MGIKAATGGRPDLTPTASSFDEDEGGTSIKQHPVLCVCREGGGASVDLNVDFVVQL